MIRPAQMLAWAGRMGSVPGAGDQALRSAPTAAQRRLLFVVLTLGTAVAAALCLPFLTRQSLWLDEAYTRAVLGAHSLSDLWNHVRATESTPPLYYLLAKLVSDVAGVRSAAAMRLPSSVAFIACVPVSYLALRRFVGWRVALAAAAVVAVNPELVQYAGDARSYALFVLCGLLSLWAFSALLDGACARRYAAWVVACTACVWTHYFGAFLVLGEIVALLWALPADRVRTLAWCLATAAAVAPLVPLAVHQNESGRADFIAAIPLLTRLQLTVRWFAAGHAPRAWLELPSVVLVIAGALIGAATAWRDRERGRLLLLGVLAATLGVPLLLSFVRVDDRFYDRNVLVALPLLAGVVALGLTKLRQLPLALLLAISIVTSLWTDIDWRYQQLDWRGALARAERVDRDAPVVTTDTSNAFVVQTYLLHAPVAAVRTEALWVIVPPQRLSGHRDLTPVPVPGGALASLRGFHPAGAYTVHGFRLQLERASSPQLERDPSGAVLFP